MKYSTEHSSNKTAISTLHCPIQNVATDLNVFGMRCEHEIIHETFANNVLLHTLFQTWAAATGKARLPTVDSLMGGMTKWLVLADRRTRRPGRSATATRGPRYRGALSCRTLYVSTAILYWTRSGTRSQCSVANASVMWSCGRTCRRIEHRCNRRTR